MRWRGKYFSADLPGKLTGLIALSTVGLGATIAAAAAAAAAADDDDTEDAEVLDLDMVVSFSSVAFDAAIATPEATVPAVPRPTPLSHTTAGLAAFGLERNSETRAEIPYLPPVSLLVVCDTVASALVARTRKAPTRSALSRLKQGIDVAVNAVPSPCLSTAATNPAHESTESAPMLPPAATPWELPLTIFRTPMTARQSCSVAWG